MLDILPPLVEGFAANILAYAVLLAAIATITMTLLELVKALPFISARLRYHRRRVRRWVGAEAYSEMLLLTVAEVESAGALFDQPTEKMMGQIQSAANVALDFPNIYPKLYSFLTRTPGSRAARQETGTGESSAEAPDATIWREYSGVLDQDRTDEKLPKGAQAAMRARARLDHFVTRKLDAFQTQTEYFWARGNQFTSVIASAILILTIIDRSTLDVSFWQGFFLATFGSMLAPFAKDVVTALSGLRAKTT